MSIYELTPNQIGRRVEESNRHFNKVKQEVLLEFEKKIKLIEFLNLEGICELHNFGGCIDEFFTENIEGFKTFICEYYRDEFRELFITEEILLKIIMYSDRNRNIFKQRYLDRFYKNVERPYIYKSVIDYITNKDRILKWKKIISNSNSSELKKEEAIERIAEAEEIINNLEESIKLK